MSIIVKSDLSRAEEFTGKSVVAKIGKKKLPVVFRVTVDDFTVEEAIDVAKRDSNILMLNYVGSQGGLSQVNPQGVYIAWSIDVGNDVSEDDIQKCVEATPPGVTLVVKVPEDYKNIRFLYEMSEKYQSVRFCGGCLFCFDECKFGCCGKDICSARGIKFDDTEYIKEGCSCAIPVFDIADVELSVATSKAKSSNSTHKKSKPNKVAMFSSLLYGNGKVEL